MRPHWIDPARFRRILTRATLLPLWVMALLAAGVVYSLAERRLALAVGAVMLLVGGLLALIGRRQIFELSSCYEQVSAFSEQQAQALREGEQQFRSIFEASRDGLLIFDDGGRICDANPAAAALFGEDRSALLGRNVIHLLRDPDPAMRFSEFIAGRAPLRAELRARRASGEVRDVEYQATLNFLPGRHLTSLRDTTERRALERELRRLNGDLEKRVRERTAQLEAANRELESFSWSVSHDLRSPLRHIDGFSQLLRRSAGGELGPQGMRYLDTITVAARRASTLVDDLLAFSRMQRTELRNAEVDMARLFEEVRREMEPEWEGRSIDWIFTDLPRVRGDGSMLRLVVRNLLSNAVKYTRPRPQARVEVRCTVVDEEHVFSVTDNGVGFEMTYVDRLFGVFKRLHREQDFEGNGIGLANVRRIVQRHGGRTWAEGKPDAGATFYFSLPIEPPQLEGKTT